ncbi:hypothetical protein EDB86DRAFT_2983360 [Lactarius hatsudake]|nr:hypothetical protein EDB86DRAFT_2983360 [Lactarius hatsudake]
MIPSEAHRCDSEAATKLLFRPSVPVRSATEIAYDSIQAAFIGYVYSASTTGKAALYQLGLTGVPITNVNNNCAAGSAALVRMLRARFRFQAHGTRRARHQDRVLRMLLPHAPALRQTRYTGRRCWRREGRSFQELWRWGGAFGGEGPYALGQQPIRAVPGMVRRGGGPCLPTDIERAY